MKHSFHNSGQTDPRKQREPFIWLLDLDTVSSLTVHQCLATLDSTVKQFTKHVREFLNSFPNFILYSWRKKKTQAQTSEDNVKTFLIKKKRATDSFLTVK